MRVLKIYSALVLEDCFYPSGIRALRAGTEVEVEVSGGTVYVLDPRMGRDMVWSTDDEDWVWRHLVMEAPWKSFETTKEAVKQ